MTVQPTQTMSINECRQILRSRMRELYRHAELLDAKSKLLSRGSGALRTEAAQMSAEARMIEAEADAIFWMLQAMKGMSGGVSTTTVEGRDAVLLEMLRERSTDSEVCIDLDVLCEELSETPRVARRRLGRLALAGFIEARRPRHGDHGTRYFVRQVAA